MNDSIKVEIEQFNEDTTILHLAGDVTTFAGNIINEAYHKGCDALCLNLILDFRENDYINSAGIAVLIGLITEARKRKQRMLIAMPSSHFQKIFRMVGLSQYADIFASLDKAIAALNTD